MNAEVIVKNLEELSALGRAIADALVPNTVLLLKGELGAGKTALVKEIGLGMGITETITSPTFTLINEYYSGRLPLYHIDLYRLEKKQHILALHIENYWQGVDFPLGVVAIEWAEKLPVLPENHVDISLQIAPEEWRIIKISGGQLPNWHNFYAELAGDHPKSKQTYLTKGADYV